MPDGVERVRVVAKEGGRMMTKQSLAEGQDVNVIVRRHSSGVNVLSAKRVPVAARYGDFSGSMDYHEALSRVREGERQFLELPAKLRTYCDNDVGKFLDLVYDPERRDELVKLGLVPGSVAEVADRVVDPVKDVGEVK